MKYKDVSEKYAIRIEKARGYSRTRRNKVRNDPKLKEKLSLYQAKYRKEHPEMFNKRIALINKLKREYNLTLEEYEAILRQQDGVCAICFNTHPTKRLAVDHNHSTLQIRGLLCYSCNTALGLLKDDPSLFQNAIKYLQHNHKQVEVVREYVKTKSKEYKEVFNPSKIDIE